MDIMKGFMILHQHFRSPQYLKWVPPPNSLKESYMRGVMAELEPLAPASRKTFAKMFETLPALISTAYTTSNIQAGWKHVDVRQNPELTFQHFPGWTNVPDDDKQKLYLRLPELAAAAMANKGTVPDEDLDRVLTEVLGERYAKGGGACSDSEESSEDDAASDDSSLDSLGRAQNEHGIRINKYGLVTREKLEKLKRGEAAKARKKARNKKTTDLATNRWGATILTSKGGTVQLRASSQHTGD